jgi:hypothetical protein
MNDGGVTIPHTKLNLKLTLFTITIIVLTLPTHCGPNIIANDPRYPLVSPSTVLKTTG